MRSIILPNDSADVLPLEGTPEIAPGLNSGKDGMVADSPTGKFPMPLTDNVATPGMLEANRILALKHAQFPKR
jgi:hypothetical protein